MVFDKDMLRGFKFNLIDSEKTIHKVIKCPYCNSNLNIYEPITSPFSISREIIIPEINEIGYWVEKCKQCHKLLKLKVHNPDLLKISYGNGDFYGFFIDEDYFELNNGIVLNEIAEVQEELVDKKIFKLEDVKNYNYNDFSLYFCNSCNLELESNILKKIKDNKSIICKEYYNYVNWSLANSDSSPENIIVKLNIKCDCGNISHAYAYKRYTENVNFDLEDSLLLVNVTNTLPFDKVILGVFTKTNIMNWLYKLLIRWGLLFDKIYLVSPFVGHQFLKSNQAVETWTKIFKFLDPNKSTIVVKKAQLNNFKKAFDETNEIKYQDLEKFNISSKFINESKSKNNFHAKFFCAIKNGRCEVMSGSSNLVEGPSYEVINFNTFYDNNFFYMKYLKPLELDIPVSSNMNGYSLFFDEDKGFKINHNSEINNQECLDMIFGY